MFGGHGIFGAGLIFAIVGQIPPGVRRDGTTLLTSAQNALDVARAAHRPI